MPARDRFHDIVKIALMNDGWTVTDDPLRLHWGSRDLYVDLGAEQLLAAEKGPQQIAVEIKSFTSPSAMDDLEKALGQFTLYNAILVELEPQRRLYLAVNNETFRGLFREPVGTLLLETGRLRLFVFSTQQEAITEWIPPPPTAS